MSMSQAEYFAGVKGSTGSILADVSTSYPELSTNYILEMSRIICWERCSKGTVGPILAWLPTLLSQVCTPALHFIAGPNLLSIRIWFSKHRFASIGVQVLFYSFHFTSTVCTLLYRTVYILKSCHSLFSPRVDF